MRGYYIYYRDIYDPKWSCQGVERKIAGQIAAFNRAGCNCELLVCPQPETVPGMVSSCLPFFPDGIDWPDVSKLANADYVYLRRPRFISKDLVRFLQQLKVANQKVLVIFELPTYPYDNEMKTPRIFAAYLKDKRHRSELQSCVDYIADLSGSQEIFGIPTIQITNGVDLTSVTARSESGDIASGTLDLLLASSFAPWHGVDRLIRGLDRYYNQEGGTRDIHLHLCGDGVEIPRLKDLASKASLDDRITFYGQLSKSQLSDVYDKCSMAIASLGLHRIGISTSATLKSREYLAKGIPFVYEGEVDVFIKEPVDFCMQVPYDDSAISIDDVIAFHDSLYGRYSEGRLIASIRNYAEEHVSVDAAMRNVTDYLNEHC